MKVKIQNWNHKKIRYKVYDIYLLNSKALLGEIHGYIKGKIEHIRHLTLVSMLSQINLEFKGRREGKNWEQSIRHIEDKMESHYFAIHKTNK